MTSSTPPYAKAGYEAIQEAIDESRQKGSRDLNDLQAKADIIFQREEKKIATQAAVSEEQQRKDRAVFELQKRAQEQAARARREELNVKRAQFEAKQKEVDDAHQAQIARRKAEVQSQVAQRDAEFQAHIQKQQAELERQRQQLAAHSNTPQPTASFPPPALFQLPSWDQGSPQSIASPYAYQPSSYVPQSFVSHTSYPQHTLQAPSTYAKKPAAAAPEFGTLPPLDPLPPLPSLDGNNPPSGF